MAAAYASNVFSGAKAEAPRWTRMMGPARRSAIFWWRAWRAAVNSVGKSATQPLTVAAFDPGPVSKTKVTPRPMSRQRFMSGFPGFHTEQGLWCFEENGAGNGHGVIRGVL